MAHDTKDMQRRDTIQLAGAGRVLSHLVNGTDDAQAGCLAAGYFNNSRHKLSPGDKITLHSDLAGATPKLTDLVVRLVPATGNITVAVAEVT